MASIDYDAPHTSVTEEYCVMSGGRRHPAYAVRSSISDVEAVIRWDGHAGLTVAHRTRTVATTPWVPVGDEKPSSTSVPHGRTVTLRTCAGSEVNFGPDDPVASDTVMLIYPTAELLGWADDYGTVTHPDHDLDPKVKAAAENLARAAAHLLAVLDAPEQDGHA